MEKKITGKKLCEEMWEIESELNLLDLKIKNIHFWELTRFPIFGELSNQLIGVGVAHTKKNRFRDKLFALGGIVKNTFLRNPFSGKYTLDFMVYDHPRKVKVEGRNFDIYTNYFIESKKDKRFDIIESPYLWKHSISTFDKNRKYTDHEKLITYIKKVKNRIELNKEEKKIIENIQYELNERFNNINIDVYKIIVKHLENFKQKVDYHKKIFNKRQPKSIYIVVSYSNISIIAAAKELGIKVIEFQHGVITDYHFAYNFSDSTKKLKYFPDKLLTFGEYWGRTEGFPKQAEIEVYGFPHLNQQLETYKGVPKKKKQVLFISQGTISKELSKLAKKIAKIMPDYYFVYKLHPGEYDRWRKEYPDLIAASQLGNFEVIDNNEKNLYSYFAESEFQVGVYSTAIFEGLTLECKTVLFNLPGIEYMEDLIQQDIVEVANDVHEAVNIMKNYKPREFPKDYFFKAK